MLVSILPASQIPQADASVEEQVLLRAVQASILRPMDSSPHGAPPPGADWQELGKITVRNKLAVLLLRGLHRSAGVPQPFRAALEEQQDATVRLNTRNLVTLRHLAPILASHQVDSVVFKGPCAQKLVYGDFFSKPSVDVDLLVLPGDFDRAGRVIADNGFAVAEECSSPWWKVFLGEQHFLSGDRMRTTVDLHHRTQQPGCPAPREPKLFLSQSMTVAVGSNPIPTLSRTNTILLSCMSLAKALTHREPAGGHVCDIAAGIRCLSQDELTQLVEDADRQGLRNTLALGLRAASLLLGVQARIEGGGNKVFTDATDVDLIKMILRPWASEIVWLTRSRMLRDLCDNRSAYLKEMGWRIAAEACRVLYERQRPDHHPSRPRPADGSAGVP